MKTSKKAFVLFAISTITLIFDQWTKVMAIDLLKGRSPLYYLWGTFHLRYAENSGAWGSLGGDWPPLWRKIFLIALPSFVLIGLAVYIFRNKEMKGPEVMAISCILAGGAGNLIDRIRFDYVVDFMYMGIGPVGTNIFNIADVVIMIGFFMLLILNIMEWKAKRDQKNLSNL